MPDRTSGGVMDDFVRNLLGDIRIDVESAIDHIQSGNIDAAITLLRDTVDVITGEVGDA